MAEKNLLVGLSTEAKQDLILTALGSLGTQTTLAQILAKLIAAPATEATLADARDKLVALAGYVDGLEGLATTLNGLVTALNGYSDGLEAGLAPLATQVTAAAILAKLSADPASQTTLAALLAVLQGVDSSGTALPTNFNGLARDLSNRDASGALLTEVRTSGGNTWTKTYTRNAAGIVTAESQWVRT